MKTKIKKNSFSSIIPIAVFIFIWQILAYSANTPLFPTPGKVGIEFISLLKNGILLENLLSSLWRVTIGFLLGSIVGIITGILMGSNKIIEKSLQPLISILYPIPTLGWLPLLIIWIGINNRLPITLIFICAFFPVTYNTLTGIKEVKEEYIKSAKVLGASQKYTLRKVVIPMALPNIFSGLRQESGMVWRTVIAAEMFAVPNGIGSLLINAESLIRVDIIMVCLGVLSFMCFIFDRSFIYIENKMISEWR